jgi:hypothetical protein
VVGSHDAFESMNSFGFDSVKSTFLRLTDDDALPLALSLSHLSWPVSWRFRRSLLVNPLPHLEQQ